MIRIPGWILGTAFVLAVAACGAGEQADESPSTTTAVRPQPQPATQPPAQPAPQPESQPQPEPEPAPPAAPTGRLYTVQVGAFIAPDSARLWSERLSRRGLPVWTDQAIVGGRMFHRLRVGATPSLAEARQLGDQLRRQYRWPVWIAPIENNAAIPPNAVSRTHALVSGTSGR